MLDTLKFIVQNYKKVPAPFLAVVLIMSGLILFLPENFAKTLAVNEFRDEYRGYIGFLFLLTLVWSFVWTCVVCGEKAIAFFTQRHEQTKTIQKSTPEEKN